MLDAAVDADGAAAAEPLEEPMLVHGPLAVRAPAVAAPGASVGEEASVDEEPELRGAHMSVPQAEHVARAAALPDPTTLREPWRSLLQEVVAPLVPLVVEGVRAGISAHLLGEPGGTCVCGWPAPWAIAVARAAAASCMGGGMA